jgi:hypothetical protein
MSRAGAIARLASLPDDRVAQLVQESMGSSASPDDGSAGAAQFYTLPTPASIAQKVFSTDFKQTQTLRSYLGSLFLIVALPALLLRAFATLGIFDSGLPAFALTFFFCAACFLLFLNFLPFFGYPKMAGRMLAHVESEGIIQREILNSGTAALVGLSPGPAPRIFDGHYSWDAGFLFFSGDRLCYVGEETRFSLRRDQIAAFQLGPGMPSWFRARSLYIVWRESPSSPSVIFNLRPLAVHSVRAMNRTVLHLEKQFESWRSGSNLASASCAACDELPLPDVRAVTGTSLSEAGKPERLPGLFILVASIAGAIGNFLNLPIEGIAPMLSYGTDSGVTYVSISGWYAMITSCFLLCLLLAPTYRSRNSAVALPKTTAPAGGAMPPPSRPAGTL